MKPATMETVRTRFAPSPTGLLHLGQALAAKVVAQDVARAAPDGVFLLRHEDIDGERVREDLLDATHVHRLLQAWLGLAEPVCFHHRLVTDAEGKRLAKRDELMTLRALREGGKTPDEILAMLED